MDYSQFRQLEFKRKFWQFATAQISIFEPTSNALVGYVKMKIFKLRSDIRVYTDMTLQREIVRIGARQIFGFKPVYNILDSNTGMVLTAMRFRSLRTYLLRGHIDLLDAQGNQYGYVQETSSQLAVMRRWVGIVPLVGPIIELALAFVPQTFDIVYAPAGHPPQLAGKIVHRKNPILVRMGLDTTAAQVRMDPRVAISICILLSILDAKKNS